MNMIASDQVKDFMSHRDNYDPNEENIINKDDDWYYNDKKYITNSQLSKLIHGGPQHLQMYREEGQKETDALIFGRAQHCLLFEPDFFPSRFYSIDDSDICEEIGGARPRTTKKYKEWLEPILEDNKHRQLLPIADLESIKNMIDKALSHKQVREYVESAKQKEVIYKGKIKGIDCKIKVDAINPGNFILDYKSTKDPAMIQNFLKAAKYKYHYDRQGAFYEDISLTKNFWFIVQEKTYPYTVCIAELSRPTKDEGVKKYMQALEMYHYHFIKNPKKINDYIEVGSI